MREAEFEGKTEEEALLKASQELGVNIADMTWEVLDRQEGLFGMFLKQVRIRVRVPEDAARLVYRAEYVPGPGDTGLRETMGARRPDEVAPAPETRQEERNAAATPPVVPAGEKGARARDFLQGILQRLEISGEVALRETDDQILLDVRSPDSDLSEREDLLGAIQFLVNKAVNRQPEDRKMVVVDAGGARDRRESALRELALRLGQRALATRKAIRMAPMDARDRRIVHLALKDVAGIQTRSEGEENQRCLIIVPDGFDRKSA